MFFPLYFPIVSKMSRAGVLRVKASLVAKHIKPVFLPGLGKLVFLDSFHQSAESAIGFFRWILGARHGLRSQEASAPSPDFLFNRTLIVAG